ncbi:transcription antitermination factor NusB [Bacteroidota bacterium]
MLNRRLLRIKVLQALYAFFQSGDDRVDISEKNLIHSIEKIYELYIYQLSLFLEVVNFARNRSKEAKTKYFPSDEELNPNTKFINNPIIHKLENNLELKEKIDYFKISWVEEKDMIRRIYLSIQDSREYKEYIESEEQSFHEDREFVIKLFKKSISRSPSLHYYYEEKNIFWAEDFHTVTILILKTFNAIDEHWDENAKLPSLYKMNDQGVNEDKEFIKMLLRKAIIRNKEYKESIAERAKNWDIERIAVIDFIIIIMAICEFVDFTSIPVKVTMNEYIEISKLYSTPKSKIFINGILDKLLADFKTEKKIVKMGRGLME